MPTPTQTPQNATPNSAALRGNGSYDGACCGVRAEVAKAASRWWLAAFAIHEVDAGVCFATGCNNKTVNWEVAGEPSRARASTA